MCASLTSIAKPFKRTRRVYKGVNGAHSPRPPTLDGPYWGLRTLITSGMLERVDMEDLMSIRYFSTTCRAAVVAMGAMGLAIISANAQQNRFPQLVGRWVNLNEGFEIRIERDGTVFSQSAQFPLSGAAGRCITAGANFCFEGTTPSGQRYRCAYSIAFLRGGEAVNYRVTQDSFVGCPNGIFNRTD